MAEWGRERVLFLRRKQTWEERSKNERTGDARRQGGLFRHVAEVAGVRPARSRAHGQGRAQRPVVVERAAGDRIPPGLREISRRETRAVRDEWNARAATGAGSAGCRR